MSGYKHRLLIRVWGKREYADMVAYSVRHSFLRQPFHKRLYEISKKANRILDCGCGNGSVIEVLFRGGAEFWGVDLSETQLSRARERFIKNKNVYLVAGDLEGLVFNSNYFDLVFSHFTLEHVDHPELAISEMVRVLKPGGTLVVMCPNYGSPFQPSACSLKVGETLFSRAVRLVLQSHLRFSPPSGSLSWDRVDPKVLAKGKWRQDWDTVVEPNLQTILPFLRRHGIEIIEYSSGLEQGGVELQLKNCGAIPVHLRVLKITRWLFEFLGRQKILPYRYWG